MGFKDNLRLYREKRGYSSVELAAILQVPYTTYKGYENQGREPKYKTLIKISNILNVSIDELLKDNKIPPEQEKELASRKEAMDHAKAIKRYCDGNCCKCVFVTSKFKIISATAPANIPPDAVLEYLQNNIEQLEIKEIYSCAFRGNDPKDWELAGGAGSAGSIINIKQE